MLTKRREIKDLEHEVAELTVAVAKLEAELTSVDSSIESDTKIEADLAQQIHRTEIELVNREKDCAAVRDEMGRVDERARTLDAEASERASLRLELDANIGKATEVLRGLEAGHTNAQCKRRIAPG